MNFFYDVGYILTNYWQNFLMGVLWTLVISLIATLIGLLIGLIIGIIRTIPKSKNKAVSVFQKVVDFLLSAYIEVFRGTPMMVQALIFKYGCAALGLNWDNIRFTTAINNVLNGWFLAGLIVITFNTAAYMAEIVQSGLNGVDKGQVEGARSLGMKSSETSFFVILPQAIRNALPTIGNELIVNIKDSSVLNVIATTELYYRIGKISVRTYAYLEGYALLAVIYLIMTLLAALVLKLIEKKLDGQKISLNPFARWKRSLL